MDDARWLAAAAGLAVRGRPLSRPNPAVGAILMSVSTIVVALNAQLLRRVDLRPAPIGQTGQALQEPAAAT